MAGALSICFVFVVVPWSSTSAILAHFSDLCVYTPIVRPVGGRAWGMLSIE